MSLSEFLFFYKWSSRKEKIHLGAFPISSGDIHFSSSPSCLNDKILGSVYYEIFDDERMKCIGISLNI